MRSNVDSSRVRGAIQETTQLFLQETMTITADVTLAAGLPMILAFDPTNTTRVITMYTPTVTALTHKHEIVNFGTGTGNLTIKDPTGVTTLGTVPPGGRAELFWNPKTSTWASYVQLSGIAAQTAGAKSTMSLYVPYASIANSQVIAAAVPFDFTLNSVLVRDRVAVTTAAKLATLTAQVNGVSCTGGVISMTSAGQTPSGATQTGTTITALNTGTAGQTVGVLASAVTTFVEGDGYLEFNLTNRSLAA